MLNNSINSIRYILVYLRKEKRETEESRKKEIYKERKRKEDKERRGKK